MARSIRQRQSYISQAHCDTDCGAGQHVWMTCRQLVLKHLSGTMKLLSHSKYPLLAQSSRSFGDLFKQHGEQFIPRVWQE